MPGSTVRLARAAAGTLTVLLLATSIAEAAPARRNQGRSVRPICGARSDAQPTRTSLVRSFTRKSLFRTSQVVHRHVMAKLQFNPIGRLIDDDAAINPAVGGHDTPVLLGALEPLGMLAVPTCQPTSHRTISRRSPRGPPWSPV
jgi:hypothetical protein